MGPIIALVIVRDVFLALFDKQLRLYVLGSFQIFTGIFTIYLAVFNCELAFLTKAREPLFRISRSPFGTYSSSSSSSDLADCYTIYSSSALSGMR